MVGKKHFLTRRRLGIAGLAAALLLPAAALFMQPAAGQNFGGNPPGGVENIGGNPPPCFHRVTCKAAGCTPSEYAGGFWDKTPGVVVGVDTSKNVAPAGYQASTELCGWDTGLFTSTQCGQPQVKSNCAGTIFGLVARAASAYAPPASSRAGSTRRWPSRLGRTSAALDFSPEVCRGV